MGRKPKKADAAYGIIREWIRSGAYEPLSQLPAILDLSIGLGISEHSIRKAIARLREEQYITTLPGKGTFVRLAKYWPDP